MRCFRLSRRLVRRSVPLAIVALSIVPSATAKEQAQLNLPYTYAADSDAAFNESSRTHTDLGVMGEVELIQERYPDGAIKIERQMTLDRDGNYVHHGSWKMFSTDGDVIAEGQYHFGQRVGMWTRWHGKKDGIFNEVPYNQFKAPFMSQANFTNGVMDGEWLIVDADQRKCQQISLKMGERHGMAITWMTNCKIFRQAAYDHGTPTGDYLEFDTQSRELKRRATYTEGRKVTNKSRDYPGTKQKKIETMYLAAETKVASADQFWNAKLAKYTTEGEALRHGLTKAWYPNGKIEMEGTYQQGKKTGTFTFWHENGQIASTGEYTDDKPTGSWVWWHENGQKSAFGRYEEGALMGEWRWWNEAGKLTKQQIYDGTESVTNQTEDRLRVSELPQ